MYTVYSIQYRHANIAGAVAVKDSFSNFHHYHPSAEMSTFEGLKVGYWNIRGLCAPLRMMVMYSGTPFHAVTYQLTEKPEGGLDSSSWFGAKPALKEANPLMNLPYIIDGDLVISQTNACFSYLGRKLKMMGDNSREEVECEQLLCECMDLRNKVVGVSYGGSEDLGAWFEKDPSASLGKLDAWLSSKYVDGKEFAPFFVGTKACAADFHIWEMCDQFTVLGKVAGGMNPLAKYPFLSKFHVGFAALPANAKYLSSKLSKLPMNNMMAAFGSAPDGSKFPLGTGAPITWADTDGMY